MKKTILTFGTMLFIGVSVSMAQSADTATEAKPAVEKQCSKGKKKACCAAKAADAGDASAEKKDCHAKGTAEATEQKATRTAAVESVSTGMEPAVK